MRKILDFKNWKDCGYNIYRFPVNDNYIYEISVICYYKCTPIETAQASLYEIKINNKDRDSENINRKLLVNALQK